MAGRPALPDPTEPVTVRAKRSVKAKFLAIAEKERRKPSELGGLVLEDYVAAWELKNGPITPKE
jgi:hypothetical protein